VTSVPYEAFPLANRPTGVSRGQQTAGASPDGAFAALMESEIAGESELIAEAMRLLQSTASPKPSAQTDGVPPLADTGTEPNPDESASPDLLTGLLSDLQQPAEAATVPAIATNPDPVFAAQTPVAIVAPPVIAAAPTPPSAAAEPTIAPALAPAMPAQAASAPSASDESTATPPAAPAAPPPASTAKPSGKTAQVQDGNPAPAQTDKIAAKAPEIPATGAQDEPPEAPEQPKFAKEQPAQPAPVRQDTLTGRSSARPDAVVTTEEPAPQVKPGVDSASQLTTPSPIHAASTQAVTPQAAPVSAAQPVPVNALAIEIAAQARAGNSRFEIRLDPPELGRIDVRLDVDREGNVTSRLVIERADTYDLLRRDQSTLERALQQAGLKTSDNALEFSLRDHGFAQHQDTDDTPRGMQAVIHDAELPPAEAASGYARLIGGRGGIDIRV
jgi:flagellar hook-length control protein FliK